MQSLQARVYISQPNYIRQIQPDHMFSFSQSNQSVNYYNMTETILTKYCLTVDIPS